MLLYYTFITQSSSEGRDTVTFVHGQYLQGVWEAGLAKIVAHVGALFVKCEGRCANIYRKFFAEHVCLYIFFNVDVIKVLDGNRIAKKVKQFLFFLLPFEISLLIIVRSTHLTSTNIVRSSI